MTIHGHPILLVEDDIVDVMTARRAMKDLGVEQRLEVRHNGEEALVFLRDDGAARPCFILLDLNMPIMNGIEFLKEIKRDVELRRIPVIVLTTSKEESDRTASFDLGVAGYIVKPVDYAQFVEAIATVRSYWELSELAD